MGRRSQPHRLAWVRPTWWEGVGRGAVGKKVVVNFRSLSHKRVCKLSVDIGNK